jgi:transcriptional regulator with GAF, ATPase, and Fis domain
MNHRAVSDREDDPAHVIAELALIRVDAASPQQILRRVAELAKQSLANVLDVSITVIEDGRPLTMIFTGQLAIDLDERQYGLGFGPCVDAATTGQTIVVNDDCDDSAYREFVEVAVRAGVRQTVAVGMSIGQRGIGALNLYRATGNSSPRAFLEDAEVFAAYAAVVVSNVVNYADAANQAANLQLAMESRAVIEQAKGIVMARERCSADEAFDILRRMSQYRNVKLREIAQAIVGSAQE